MNSHLPVISSQDQAVGILKQLVINQLAFQVNKLDTEDAIVLLMKPRAGVPCLQINYDQQFGDDNYICWFYEAPVGIMTYVYAVSVLVLIFGVILFPLWPLPMRLGIWYLSMAFLSLVVAFFGIALLRLAVYICTWLVIKPGIWIFPNLFEDLGIIQSFIPIWAWHGVDTMKMHRPKKRISKKRKLAKLEKQRVKDEQMRIKQEAEKELQVTLELINAKIQAMTEEREQSGKPMEPDEIAQLGQQLFSSHLSSIVQMPDEEPDEEPDDTEDDGGNLEMY